jgi:O-succinylbenzoate synthase
VADIDPGFSEEFNQGAWIVLKEFLGPALLGAGEISAADIEARFASVRGNPMAKATLINAVIDAELKAEGLSLSRWLGGDKDRVPCGVSVGITPTTQDLIEQVDGYLAEGYRRIKLKIEPRTDVERVEAVRGAHPGVALSVDANAAYSLDAIDVFTALDRSRLLMIEQPLHYSDLLEHAKLQRAITTDLCLDESIRSAADARAAIELGSCRIVNIKQGRVGGVLEAVRVHDTCREAGVPVWCGGMLETGVGRATNLGLASLPNFTLPGDTSASSRYFHEDLTEPFEMSSDGMMEVPKGPGIGVEPLTEVLVERTIRRETLRR